MRNLKTAGEVVEVLGGHKIVCKMAKANRKASYYWVGSAGTFPARTFDMMTKALKKKRCKAPPSLWGQLPEYKKAA